MRSFATASFPQENSAQGHQSLPRILVHLSLALLALLLSVTASAQARATRVVIIKIDGLPYEMVQRFAREHDR